PPASELKSTPEIDGPACILFRSGASGKPEGVLLSQQALLGSSFASALDYTAKDRVALSINFSHEVGCLQVFAVLASGSCAVNLAQKPVLSPWEISKLLQEEQVSVLCSPAALLERMARSFSSALKKLRLILCDDHHSLASRVPEKLREAIAERTFGIYGSSELGRWPLLYPLRPSDSISLENVAGGTRLHLLDSQREPTPYGLIGEIFIECDDLAFGYDHSPERTAETFLPHPFSQVPGARLFRIGDSGRRRHDGQLQFCGRRDGSTRVRGVRVHTKEIERVLFAYGSVQEAAVLAQEKDGFRDPAIEAFVVATEEK